MPANNKIPSEILKENGDILSEHISYIVNNMFECGFFPSCIKIGVIKPIHKKVLKSQYRNTAQ